MSNWNDAHSQWAPLRMSPHQIACKVWFLQDVAIVQVFEQGRVINEDNSKRGSIKTKKKMRIVKWLFHAQGMILEHN